MNHVLMDTQKPKDNSFGIQEIKGRYIAFAEKYERHIGILALIGGFIFDTLTLGEPGQLLGNIVLGFYFIVSAGCIVALSAYSRLKKNTPLFLLFILQFAFGNIAGGLTVLYGQSGTFEGSFLFFAILGAFILFNELLRHRYALFIFHTGAWFFLFIAYASLAIPSLTKEMGDTIFIGGIFFAIAAVLLLMVFVYIVSPAMFVNIKKRIGMTLGGIALFYIGLYFLNIIPPVPLSLNQVGIFHSIVRTDAGYEATYETPEWYEFFRFTHNTFSITQDTATAYCFSSIRAPAGLTTAIYHRWEIYDELKRGWQTQSRISFAVVGGRTAGYRGYTQKENLLIGKWRCSVETARGALIGRTTFMVVEGERAPLSAVVF